MPKPTLSVLMSNYNYGKYIGEALEAIINQSYMPLEVIVIDDASTDNSTEIIQHYADICPVIKLIKNDKNIGAIATANKLLNLAQGDYVFYNASDDTILPGFFECALKLLEKHPRVGLFCSNFLCRRNRKAVDRQLHNRLSNEDCYISPDQLAGLLRKKYYHLAGFTAVFKKSAVLECGGFLQELGYGCDGLVILALAFRKGICYSPRAFSLIRPHENTMTRRTLRNKEQTIKFLKVALDTIKSPKFCDIFERVRDSNLVAPANPRFFSLIKEHPEYREFLPTGIKGKIESILIRLRDYLYPAKEKVRALLFSLT